MKQIFRQILITEIDTSDIPATFENATALHYTAVLTSRDDVEGKGGTEDEALKDLFRKLLDD